MKCMGLLLGCWLLWGVFTSAISPSYLVEGMRNTVGFQFSSKGTYVYAVQSVRGIYLGMFGLLGATSIALLYQAARQR